MAAKAKSKAKAKAKTPTAKAKAKVKTKAKAEPKAKAKAQVKAKSEAKAQTKVKAKAKPKAKAQKASANAPAKAKATPKAKAKAATPSNRKAEPSTATKSSKASSANKQAKKPEVTQATTSDSTTKPKKAAATKTTAKKKAATKKATTKKKTRASKSKELSPPAGGAKASSQAALKAKELLKPKKPLRPAMMGNMEVQTPTYRPDSPFRNFEPYMPEKTETYMNPKQVAHFRNILVSWRHELMEEVDRTVHHMRDEAANFPDPADRATQEEEFSIELRTRDRERKLIRKIDQTLELLEQDDYGYCDTCGIEIGIRRLEARPTATQCVDCKSLQEIKERQLHG